MVVFGQKWLYLDKLVSFVQIGSIWAEVVLFGLKVAVFGQKWLDLDKLVLSGKIGSNWAKVVQFRQRWLYLGKSGCIWEIGCN